MSAGARVSTLEGDLQHFSVRDAAHHHRMIGERYAPLAARQMFESGRRTSPLRIALAQIGQLDLLRHLFATVLIPGAVAAEVAPEIPSLPSWVTATPLNENYRSEQHFTAGWIALRFLHEPSVALGHFARIAADGVTNPMTLARAYYWQGRAAEALGHERDASGHYEVAARYSTAYYGQLARARLGIESVALRPPPPSWMAAESRFSASARSFENTPSRAVSVAPASARVAPASQSSSSV